VQADLKLVANPSFPPRSGTSAISGNQAGAVMDLLLNSSGANEVNEEYTASYKTLAVVLAAHVLIAAGMLHSWHDTEIIREPAIPMMVSLVNRQASISERQLTVPAPETAKQVLEKKAPVVKQKLIPSKLPATELVATEMATKEQVKQAVATEATDTPVKLEEAVQKAEAVTVKTDAELVTEPPKFGAAYLNNPAPAYPPMSRRTGEQGRVLLKVLVSESGIAERVQLETGSGYEKLDQAAIEAVKKWIFIPAKRSNQPVSAYVLVPVKFSLGS